METSHTGAPVLNAPAPPGESHSRVSLTQDAVDLLVELIDTHGQLMFHQSGGCCDGSAPMCYPAGEFITGTSDVLLGTFTLPGVSEEKAQCEFWMSKAQFEYWKHTHITVDVVVGRGSGFSVESPTGKRFIIRSRLMEK